MRGIYIPKNIKTMPLSEDARNVLTSLVLDEPVSLHQRSVGIGLDQEGAAEMPAHPDGITGQSGEDRVDQTDMDATGPEPLQSQNGEDFDETLTQAEAEANEDAGELLSVLSGVDEEVSIAETEGEGDVTFLASEGNGFDEALDKETFDDEPEDSPRGFMRFFRRTEEVESGSSLKSVVGLKDVRRAFEQQTTSSPYLTTTFLIVLLLLVAAIPPIVNLSYIQPTITDNNQKMSMMANFSAQIEAKTNESRILQNKIKKLENNLGGYALNVKSQADYDFLVTAFLGALERYDVKILSNQSKVDESLTTKLDDNKSIEGVMMDLELQTRFDVYQNIRHIFMEQMGSVNVIEEKITARPGENELNIRLKMAVVYLKEAE